MRARPDLEELLKSGRETQRVEFKASMAWSDPATQGKVIRAALAMANRRDGGILAFGLDLPDGETTHRIIGMSDAHYESFNQDDVLAAVNAHAAPHIDLTVDRLTIDQKKVVAIIIQEFVDYPVVCARDFVVGGRPVVIRGKVYCRSRRMAESVEVQSPDDMRDIIELATAKGLERYYRLREIEKRSTGPSAADLFDRELGDLRR